MKRGLNSEYSNRFKPVNDTDLLNYNPLNHSARTNALYFLASAAMLF